MIDGIINGFNCKWDGIWKFCLFHWGRPYLTSFVSLSVNLLDCMFLVVLHNNLSAIASIISILWSTRYNWDNLEFLVISLLLQVSERIAWLLYTSIHSYAWFWTGVIIYVLYPEYFLVEDKFVISVTIDHSWTDKHGWRQWYTIREKRIGSCCW